MKKYVFKSFAILLAIASSAFTINNHKKMSPNNNLFFLIYLGYEGQEMNIYNYEQAGLVQIPNICLGGGPKLCWISVPTSIDINLNNHIEQGEFDSYIKQFDTDYDGDFMDNIIEDHLRFEKKF